MQKLLSLTNYFSVVDQTHISYIFEKEDIYLENLMAYIKTGIALGHEVIIIDSKVICDQVKARTKELFTLEQTKSIHFVDNYSFYNYHKGFQIKKILENFMDVLRPLINENLTIRTWANVVWKDIDDFINKLEEYETLADKSIIDMGVISICAYPAKNISASMQYVLMRTHEYLMTDDELVRSPLYR